ncbi:MAG: hypothetical protein KBD16_03260 [Candidatus Pacebacteria bacterium]|nr:hypothetical protein [Candidatus Paceibacterota bacterium]
MNKKFFLNIAIVVVVLLAVTTLYYKTSRSTFKANQQLSETEVNAIIEAVKRHMYVPEEEPLIATIADIDMLVSTQPFYQGADNGDILLIYPSISKAILYDPEGDRLINVGPIILDEDTSPESESVNAPAPLEEQPVDGPVETQ